MICINRNCLIFKCKIPNYLCGYASSAAAGNMFKVVLCRKKNSMLINSKTQKPTQRQQKCANSRSASHKKMRHCSSCSSFVCVCRCFIISFLWKETQWPNISVAFLPHTDLYKMHPIAVWVATRAILTKLTWTLTESLVTA